VQVSYTSSEDLSDSVLSFEGRRHGMVGVEIPNFRFDSHHTRTEVVRR
jgi:hypothetical protein